MPSRLQIAGRKSHWIFALLVCLLFSFAFAQADLENQVRRIGNELRCPVCGGSAITESPSDFARSMLAEVRAQVQAGKSEREIYDYFSGKYGSTVLLRPPFQGMHVLVWVLPILVLLGGAYVLWDYLRRSSGQKLEEVNPVALAQVRKQLEARRNALDNNLNTDG
ncbi:MAG: cytochrome c-type biogenesis protein CcmH [Deinococcales bacterium]